MTDLLLTALATWYVSYAITSTDGPGGVFERSRNWKGGKWHGRHGVYTWESLSTPTQTKEIPNLNGLLDCPVCLAFWVALILLLVPMGIVVQALAVAGAAMLAHSASGWRFGNG